MMRSSHSSIRAIVEALEDRKLLTAYYISPAGHDNNPGTLDKPWRTISKINNVIFKPGDSILFSGGSTFTGTLYLDKNDVGTSAAPIKIGSYGTGRASIGPNTGTGIYCYNTSGISISNLNLVGTGST